VASRGRDEWQDDFEVYTSNQVEAILAYCDVEVDGDTHTHFLAFCPFHGNEDTPAMAVDKVKGLWTCFNPSCMEAGTLDQLLRRTKKLNPFQAKRVISKNRNATDAPYSKRLEQALSRGPMFVPFPASSLDRLHENLEGSRGMEYMLARHFTPDTLNYFRIGYSEKKNMVTVPMHDPEGMPVGMIGRSASFSDKTFENSPKLPKSLTAWNFHRAKVTGDTVIICEASFDAMRVHQAGYPNVIALLGGSLSPFHAQQIGKTFSSIIIMTDFDALHYYPNCRRCRGYERCQGHRPGRDLGRTIAQNLSNKKIRWGAYDETQVFPVTPLQDYRDGPAKDASNMTDNEIRKCLRGAVSNLRYEQLRYEERYQKLVAV
jgi:DNA primase